MMTETTDFGFKKVPRREKAQRVAEVFHSVAKRYDVMNDLMSMGVHRIWKHFTILTSQVREGQSVLDVAAGTGDLTRAFAEKVGEGGLVVSTDINPSMLLVGRDRLINRGLTKNIRFAIADAENLPFPDQHFDHISIGFGLRNVTDKARALRSMARVLKTGGQLMILEFSKPVFPWLNKLYDTYSFNILPRLGQWVADDRDSYQYLAESIRMHPDQETLKQLILANGFTSCEYQNLSAGIVALHRAVKI